MKSYVDPWLAAAVVIVVRRDPKRSMMSSGMEKNFYFRFPVWNSRCLLESAAAVGRPSCCHITRLDDMNAECYESGAGRFVLYLRWDAATFRFQHNRVSRKLRRLFVIHLKRIISPLISKFDLVLLEQHEEKDIFGNFIRRAKARTMINFFSAAQALKCECWHWRRLKISLSLVASRNLTRSNNVANWIIRLRPVLITFRHVIQQFFLGILSDLPSQCPRTEKKRFQISPSNNSKTKYWFMRFFPLDVGQHLDRHRARN